MSTWRPPKTKEEMSKLIAEELEECTPEQRAVFEKYRVPIYVTAIKDFWIFNKMYVFVVAQKGDEVMYFEDKEMGFNFSPLDKKGRIVEHLCNQDDLKAALLRWTERDIDYDEAERWIHQIHGNKVSHSWCGDRGSIFLELGDLRKSYNRKHPKGDLTIQIKWPWEIEDDASILVGNRSNDFEIENSPDLLKNLHIKESSLLGINKKIRIVFEEGLCLSSLAEIAEDPQWMIFFRFHSAVYFKDGSFKLGPGSERFAVE